MDYALLTDIKKKLFIRSALISLPSLDDLLGLNDYLSADEILLELIKKSLREFELSNPLVIDMRVNREQLKSCTAPQGYGEVVSNFTLYLDCRISEDQIILVPNAIPKWRLGGLSYPTAGNYTFFTDYRRPYVFIGDLPMHREFWMRGICSRPIVPDFTADRTFNTASGKSAIYWLNIEEGARGVYFLDLCMMNLLDFIRQMKASLTLPNTSVDILGNVDNAYMEIRSRCEQYVLQSGWYGDLIM